ncbi:hypothetical protein U2F26_34520 [Micromonospora sp. 4G57]|uniref:Uncharacterized protein n=1 Tax=Micromonospora sicca TaxID=2202420 RepID=A0ABU5JQ21_9ACTN|nr:MULTISPECIES: hypothetical protein [unclassified Micromonospora]MDZ5447763.1 hypothetical protein [Micromonospora sp. 4G57]MDZ5494474.1 hypothetical protein [Micromonospora sp. 4G53]
MSDPNDVVPAAAGALAAADRPVLISEAGTPPRPAPTWPGLDGRQLPLTSPAGQSLWFVDTVRTDRRGAEGRLTVAQQAVPARDVVSATRLPATVCGRRRK